MRHSALKTSRCCWNILITWTISKIKTAIEIYWGVYTMIFCKKTIAEADVSALSDGFVFYMMKYVVWPPAILPDIPTDRI